MTHDTHWLTVTSNCHCNACSGLLFLPFHTWTAASLCQIDMAHMIHHNTSDSSCKSHALDCSTSILEQLHVISLFWNGKLLGNRARGTAQHRLKSSGNHCHKQDSDMFSQVNLNFELNVNQRHWHSWITRSLLLALQRPWSSSWVSHADSTFLSEYWTLKRGYD